MLVKTFNIQYYMLCCIIKSKIYKHAIALFSNLYLTVLRLKIYIRMECIPACLLILLVMVNNIDLNRNF